MIADFIVSKAVRWLGNKKILSSFFKNVCYGAIYMVINRLNLARKLTKPKMIEVILHVMGLVALVYFLPSQVSCIHHSWQ